MNKRKLVLDLIVSDSCNKDCFYCPMKFSNKFINKSDIKFLLNYLNSNSVYYDECTINFFWWEPLLNFEMIKYFIESNDNKKIKYTIGTNWTLLDEKKFDFFSDNNVKIYLTLHSDNYFSYKEILNKKFLLKHKDIIQINFICSPDLMDTSYMKFDDIIKFWLTNINIIPVMLTMKWDITSIKKFKNFIKFVDSNYTNLEKYKIYKFSYFDWIPEEIGFVVDINLNIYQDSSDELYIWKYFSKLWNKIINDIEKFSFLWNLKDKRLNYFISKYDVKNILKMLYLLPKKLWYIKDYLVIHRIVNSDLNNRSVLNWNIYQLFIK